MILIFYGIKNRIKEESNNLYIYQLDCIHKYAKPDYF